MLNENGLPTDVQNIGGTQQAIRFHTCAGRLATYRSLGPNERIPPEGPRFKQPLETRTFPLSWQGPEANAPQNP